MARRWTGSAAMSMGAMALWLLAAACSDDSGSSSGGDDDGGSGGTGTGIAATGSGAGTTGAGAGTTGAGAGGCDGGPLAAPLPNCTLAVLPSTGDPHQDCVDRINQFRWECQCLPPLARWTEAEDCSNGQSATDQSTNSPHGSFGSCGENAQNTCPNWGGEADVIGGCLQMMWDEGPGEPFSEHGHYINMSSMSYSKVACGFSSSGEGTWSNQNFAP